MESTAEEITRKLQITSDFCLAWKLQAEAYKKAFSLSATSTYAPEEHPLYSFKNAREETISFSLKPTLGDGDCFFHAVEKPGFNRAALVQGLLDNSTKEEVRSVFAHEIRQFLYLGYTGFVSDSASEVKACKQLLEESKEISDFFSTLAKQNDALRIKITEARSELGEEVTKGKQVDELLTLLSTRTPNLMAELALCYQEVLSTDNVIYRYCSQENIFRRYVELYLREARGYIPFLRDFGAETPTTIIDVINQLFQLNIQVYLQHIPNKNELILVTNLQSQFGEAIPIFHNGIAHFSGLSKPIIPVISKTIDPNATKDPGNPQQSVKPIKKILTSIMEEIEAQSSFNSDVDSQPKQYIRKDISSDIKEITTSLEAARRVLYGYNIYLAIISSNAELPDFSTRAKNKFPVIVKKGNSIHICSRGVNGALSYTQLDATKFISIQFPETSDVEIELSREETSNFIYDEINLKLGSSLKKREQAVIFIGDTGSGKTTLLNYLSGIPLTSIERQGLQEGFIIDVVNKNQGFKIGHDANSQTTIPNIWVNDTGTIYCDCPGFFANVGTVQNVIDAVCVKEVFEKIALNVKLVVVVELDSLLGRTQGLTSLLYSLKNLLGDFNYFKNAISLIVTKMPGHLKKTPRDVSATLQTIFKARKQHIQQEENDILTYFINNPEKIALFNGPDENGPISEDNRIAILKILNDTAFVASKEIGFALSPTSELNFLDLFDYTTSLISLKTIDLFEIIKTGFAKIITKKQFDKLLNLISSIKPLLSNTLKSMAKISDLQNIFDNLNLDVINEIESLIFIRYKLSDLSFFENIVSTCTNKAPAFLNRTRNLLQFKITALEENTLEIIISEFDNYIDKAKEVVGNITSNEELIKLQEYKDFFTLKIDELDNVDDFDKLKINLDSFFIKFNILHENNLFICFEILKMLNINPNKFIPSLKVVYEGFVESLICKIDILTAAEAILKNNLTEEVQTYIQTIDKNKLLLSIAITNKTLINLKSKIAGIVNNDDVLLQDFSYQKLIDYPEFIVSCLQPIDTNSFPLLKISNETKEILENLLTFIDEWSQWYKIVPSIYHYLSINDPIPRFNNGGISESDFVDFLDVVKVHENLEIEENINCDNFKICQLNELIVAIWNGDMQLAQQNNGEIVTITANCIKISDVLAHVNELNNARVLKIECFNTIHFDCDLTIPGLNIIIFSPVWRIGNSPRELNLSGNHAQQHANALAASGNGRNGINGINGTDGLPGRAGQNGGSFYGKGKEFIGLECLTIRTSGGNSGNGQNGGNGSTGQDGTDAGQNCSEGTIKGTLGGFGGNAGRGGSRGIAGNSGITQILKGMQDITGSCHQVIANAGINGTNGVHGQLGNGGKYGNDWYYHKTTTSHLVPAGKGYYSENRDSIDSHAVINNTRGNNGQPAQQLNITDQEQPLQTNLMFDQAIDTAVTQFRAFVENMFRIGETEADNIVLKIQRPILDEFIPKAGFGVIDFQGNFTGVGFCSHQNSSIWHPYWSEYSKVGITELLILRLKSAGIEEINVVSPNYVWQDTDPVAKKLAKDIFGRISKTKETVLAVLNLYGQHWVGMVIEKNMNSITINYIDPEQKVLPKLLQQLLKNNMQQIHPDYEISFNTIKIKEQQKYNNCGPEVIENLMYYLTGKREEQDDAIVLHSRLLETTLV